MEFLIKAFYDDDDTTTHKTTIIRAKDIEEARSLGWELYPDCDSIGVYEYNG